MYQITIETEKQGESTLKLETENRAYARYCQLLCEENKLVCKVVKTVEPQSVKFR